MIYLNFLLLILKYRINSRCLTGNKTEKNLLAEKANYLRTLELNIFLNRKLRRGNKSFDLNLIKTNHM